MSVLTDDELLAAYFGADPTIDKTNALRAVADAAVAAYVDDHLVDLHEMVEPFGYFRAEPFGWTECAPDDEGAVALYERPHQSEDKLEMVLPEGYALVPIEVGGVYETHNGRSVTIIKDDGTGCRQFWGSNAHWYRADGKASIEYLDLIKCLDKPEPKKPSLKKLLKGKTISGLTIDEAHELAKLLSCGTILIVGE